MKRKISETKKKLVRKDRKNGCSIGELSWKFNLSISEIERIVKKLSKQSDK